MLAFYVDSSACKNIPVRPETNFVHPEATRDFILKGTNWCQEDGDERVKKELSVVDDNDERRDFVFLNVEFLLSKNC